MPKCDFNKLQSNFIEITLWHWCSPVNLLHIFRTLFPKHTSEWLILYNDTKKLMKASSLGPFNTLFKNLRNKGSSKRVV